ncbi:MAG: spore protease YyaC [Clostridia bacterium]|nr:spore protease YyaC [Clostridia bacterium]
MTKFVFNSANYLEFYPLSSCLKQLINNNFYPVFVCFGSDLSIGDSLGPKIGQILLNNLEGKCYVYGTLKSTITAKEANTVSDLIRKLHPKSTIIAIDAAVGNKYDVGLVKLFNDGLKPGLGVNKDLNKIGDVSIIAIIGEKNEFNKNLFTKASVSFIENLSKLISKSIIKAIND